MNNNRDLLLRSYLKKLCRKHNIKFVSQYLPTLQQYRGRYCWPDDYFMVVDVLALHTNISRVEYRKILRDVKKIIDNGHTQYDKKNRE